MRVKKAKMNNARSFEDQTDGVRVRTAESLESAADSVRAAGEEGASTISGLANEAGDKLDSTASYVRTFAQGDVLAGVRQTVRSNPMGSVALAIAIGLVAGFSWRTSGRRS
jgi:ElaB/YqjD/DUF883 family membrane-anchored ribosome-binding protein